MSRDKIAMDLLVYLASRQRVVVERAYGGSRMLTIPKRKNVIESSTAPCSLSDVVLLVTCS